MKFSCEKALLQSAINTASRAVSSKSSIPALEGLLLEGRNGYLTVSGYNMQLGIRSRFLADIIEEGEIVLNARLFGDIIRKMPDDVIVFSADEKMMVSVTCGDADFHVLGLSAGDFPELPDVEDDYCCTLKQSVLKNMIGGTSFAVSTNESRIVHTGALFEIGGGQLTMVAVDGFRLALRREAYEKIEGGSFTFVAPGSALNEVEKVCADSDDTAMVILGSRHVQFEVGETQLICRRLEGEFLDYEEPHPLCIRRRLCAPLRQDRQRRRQGQLPHRRQRRRFGNRLQQPLPHGRPALRPGGRGENRAQQRHHALHHRAHGGGGEFPLHGAAGAVEGGYVRI